MTASKDQTVRVWKKAMDEWLAVATLGEPHHKHWIFSVMFIKGDTEIFTGSKDSTILVWKKIDEEVDHN